MPDEMQTIIRYIETEDEIKHLENRHKQSLEDEKTMLEVNQRR